MTQQKQTITAIVIILFLGVLFHNKYINEFPSYIHAWSQSDRYALALGFANNDLNFFKPETFSLLKNAEAIDEWKYPSDNSITAVNFPIHDFLPAFFMKITGNSSPFIFRVYILLYSFIGLLFLFKLSQLWTRSFFKSILILIFAATSPVFVYYQGGFMPTIPSLSNSIIGIYLYSLYLSNSDNKYFNFSLLFLTIAALCRTTFAIPLIAIWGFELLRILKGNTRLMPKLLPALLSIVFILFYSFYNDYLTAKFGSIFLNQILPAKSFNEALEIIKIAIQNWGFQYFSIIHYLLLICLVLTSVFYLLSKKTRILDKTVTLFLLVLIMFIGCIAFSILMLRQFPDHDYYFLDTFYLPVILLLIFLVTIIPLENSKRNNSFYLITILLLSISMIVNAVNTQKNRRKTGYWDRTTSTINNFTGMENYLDSISIPKNSKMLVLDANATNIPLILMNRKGYPIILNKKEYIERALKWDYDYVVFQNEFFLSKIYSVYPEIISRIKKVADNEKISVCVLSDSISNNTLYKFLGIEDKTQVFGAIMTYDTMVNESWQNINSTSDFSFSGTNSGFLTHNMTYGLTYKTKDLPVITQRNRILLFSSYFLQDTINNCEIVVSINENGKTTYYNSFKLQEFLKMKNKWESVDLLFLLPKVKSEDYEFALYIWNTGKNDLLIDDFGFKIY